MERRATFSRDHRFRYALLRVLGDGPTITWIMLNPSTADATRDDATIRRAVRFSAREGFGTAIVVNLFGFVATDPRALAASAFSEGEENASHVDRAMRASDRIVVAWGTLGHRHRHRSAAFRAVCRAAAAGTELDCFGIARNGAPRHPLYVRADAPIMPWHPATSCAEERASRP